MEGQRLGSRRGRSAGGGRLKERSTKNFFKKISFKMKKKKKNDFPQLVEEMSDEYILEKEVRVEMIQAALAAKVFGASFVKENWNSLPQVIPQVIDGIIENTILDKEIKDEMVKEMVQAAMIAKVVGASFVEENMKILPRVIEKVPRVVEKVIDENVEEGLRVQFIQTVTDAKSRGASFAEESLKKVLTGDLEKAAKAAMDGDLDKVAKTARKSAKKSGVDKNLEHWKNTFDEVFLDPGLIDEFREEWYDLIGELGGDSKRHSYRQ